MNGIWQGQSEMINVDILIQAQRMLAQAPQPPNIDLDRPGEAVEAGVDYTRGLLTQIIDFIPELLAALAILLIGLLIAAIAKAIVRGILNRTSIDNRIAGAVLGRTDRSDLPQVEGFFANLVFWIITLFTIVAVLNALNLEVVSRPLGGFLNQIFDFIPRLVGAAIWLGVAWLVASLVKTVTTRGLHALRVDERLDQRPAGTPREQNQLSLSETIGNALYWLIFLLFLLPILDTLGLQQALRPVQNLIEEIISILPNILAAVLIAAAGWLLATIVRRIVTNLLASTGVDQLGNRFGLRRTTATSQSLSGILGTIVYVLILIPVAIAALNALRIDAISVPAIAMLNQILTALPAIFTAVLILFAAYFLGRFVADLVSNILTSLGFNNIFSHLGLPSPARRTVVSMPSPPSRDFTVPPTEQRVVIQPPPRDFTVPPTEQRTVIQPESTVIQPEPTAATAVTTRTPSEIAGIIVLVGIMLFATVAAVNILNIAALTLLVSGLIVVFGRILSGLVVFAVGLFLANLAYNIITSSGDRQAQILAQVARIAIIVFVSALALQQIGIASEIVNLAFGLLLGAIAVALALAVGLGSRDIAREQVKELLDSFKQQRNQPPKR
jgi:small-conductance mechanosensitive channel